METLRNTVQHLFEGILQISWQAAIIVCLILTIQWLLRRKLSARLRHAIWLVLLVKLCVPLLPQSNLSLFNYFRIQPSSIAMIPSVNQETESDKFVASAPSLSQNPLLIPTTNEPAIDSVISLPAIANNPSLEATPSTVPLASVPRNWMKIACEIWLLVVCFLFIRLVVRNFKFGRIIRRNPAIQDPSILNHLRQHCKEMDITRIPHLRETDTVQTPAIFGWITPKIILPKGVVQELSSDELRYIFLHELAHIKRHDLFLNWLTNVLQILHWFNPILWFAFARMRADCELATDALALKHTKPDENQPYGETILNLLERVGNVKPIPGLVGIIENKKEIKNRIISIRDIHRSRKFSIIGFALIAAVIVASLTIRNEAAEAPSTALPVAQSEPESGETNITVITGTVLDDADIPISNANISFGQKYESFFKHAETNSDGEFIISSTLIRPDIVIEAGGYALLMEPFSYDLSQTNRTFHLSRGTSISGTVIDSSGSPVEGVRVAPEDWYGYRGIEWRESTDAFGKFAWHSAPLEGAVEFSILKTGYKMVRDRMLAVGADYTIALEPPLQVTGAVVDAKTGENISRFEVLPRYGFEIGDQTYFRNFDGEGTEGEFSINIHEPAVGFHLITIRAEGYAAIDSEPFRDNDGDQVFHFELQPSNLEPRIIRLSNGELASGATVVLLEEGDHNVWVRSPYELDVSRLNRFTSAEGRITTTNGEGTFQIEPSSTTIGAAIAHPGGYLEISLNDLENMSEIVLEPWARIEGKLLFGDQPAVGQSITIFPFRWRQGTVNVAIAPQVTTDENGEFIFEGIPAEDYYIRTNQEGRVGIVEINPGETITLNLGAGSRTLAGKVIAEEELGEVNWQRDPHTLATPLPKVPNVVRPEFISDPSDLDGYWEQINAYWRSDEGKEILRQQRVYELEFENDGSFKIQGVEPGVYELKVNLRYREKVGPNSFSGGSLGFLTQEIIVPEADEGEDVNEPIDLGEFIVPKR